MRSRLFQVWFSILVLATVFTLWSGSAQAQDPRQWGPDGLAIRQGYHVEWQRASYRRADGYVLVVWSDCRVGTRDIYGQLFAPNGREQWPNGGKAIAVEYSRQEDPDVIAASDNNWIIAWSDFRTDVGGDVWAQKINDAGDPLWDPHGVVVDVDTTVVYELTVRIASDGAGGAIVAWEESQNTDLNIYAQRVSSTGQRVWARKTSVAELGGDQDGITAEGDGLGNMFIAWNDKRDPSDMNIYAAKVTASGTTPWGPNGTPVCTAPLQQSAVKLCYDGAGGCYMAWEDQRSGSAVPHDLYAQHMSSTGTAVWQANGLLLCGKENRQTAVRVALSSNGGTADGLLTVWEDRRVNNQTAEVYCQKTSPSGVMMWNDSLTSEGKKVCGDATGEGGHGRNAPRLTSDLQGGAIVAWEDTRSDGDPADADLYAVRVLANGNLSWNGPCGNLVADGVHQQGQPVIRMADANHVDIHYDDLRFGSQALRYALMDLNSGTEIVGGDSAQIVYGLDGDADLVKAITTRPGEMAMVWKDFRLGGGACALFYQMIDTTGHFIKALNGERLVTDNEGLPTIKQDNPQVCPDGTGGFFVVFQDQRADYWRVRVTRVNADGEVVGPAAGTVVLDDPNTRDQQFPVMTPDGQGGVYVGWVTYDPSYYTDLYMQHLNSACENLWTPALRMTADEMDDLVQNMTTSTDGCCIVTWCRGGGGDKNVSAARVCSDGTITWRQMICDTVNLQKDPCTIPDGQGGAYFAWSDYRTPYTDVDVYAQHVTAQGQETWQHNGIIVVSDTLQQSNPVMAMDMQGNIHIAWQDYRSSNFDVYAQLLSPTGQRMWAAGGRAVCTAPGDQTDIAISPEWNSGAYMLWSDSRGAKSDIYGSHLTSTGAFASSYWSPVETAGAICDYYEDQKVPSLADDWHGGVMAAWVDQRSSGKEPLKEIWANWVNDYTVGVTEVPAALPTKPELSQNYPNPFNPTTRFAFSIPATQRVEIAVYNTLGQKVATLVDKVMTAGRYEVNFEGRSLASGIYFYRLKTTGFEDVKKMMLLK